MSEKIKMLYFAKYFIGDEAIERNKYQQRLSVPANSVTGIRVDKGKKEEGHEYCQPNIIVEDYIAIWKLRYDQDTIDYLKQFFDFDESFWRPFDEKEKN